MEDRIEYSWDGSLRGGDRALIEMLDHYRGPEQQSLSLTLPVENWAKYAFLHSGSNSQAGAAAGTPTIYTVPADVRAELLSIQVYRASGDNTLDGLDLVYPSGYYVEGATDVSMSFIEAAGLTTIYWPDPAGLQSTATLMGPPAPLLLEPGFSVRMDMSGAGVSTTVLQFRLALRLCRIIRAQSPRPI